jgi:hypothetical protein
VLVHHHGRGVAAQRAAAQRVGGRTAAEVLGTVGPNLFWTLLLLAAPARCALQAAVDHAANADVVAHFHLGHGGAYSRADTSKLVARHAGVRLEPKRAKVPSRRVHVRVACRSGDAMV